MGLRRRRGVTAPLWQHYNWLRVRLDERRLRGFFDIPGSRACVAVRGGGYARLVTSGTAAGGRPLWPPASDAGRRGIFQLLAHAIELCRVIRTEPTAGDSRLLTVTSTTTTHRRSMLSDSSPNTCLAPPAVRCLAWATDLDVLPANRIVERRGDHWLIRSPSNLQHWWGNFLLFDEPPRPGDGQRWEALASAELPRACRHRAFAWDSPLGEPGAAGSELMGRGYELELTAALIARPRDLRPRAGENREVVVRPLDPGGGADRDAWRQVVELAVEQTREDGFEDLDGHRTFSVQRQADLRALFMAGRGAWWVAELPGGEVAGSLGLVVTNGRGRFQTVGTASAQRRKGICSRLVVEAARRSAERHRVEQLVICADPGYHALGLYESLGFRRTELVAGAVRRPQRC